MTWTELVKKIQKEEGISYKEALKRASIVWRKTGDSKSKPFIDEDAFYEKLVITLGPKGCKYKDKIYPVEKTEVIDQVGAGDTFIAALAVKFLENNQIHESIEFANLCATKAVKKKGVIAVKK